MKLNISNPTTGCQKLIEIEDEKKLRMFLDKRMSSEVPGDSLGEEFKGYIFKITGGNDKEGFPMKQGVLVNGRVRLLMRKGHSCFRERRSGEKIRKSVRGCITGSDLSVMSLVVVKKGEGELPGLTDEVKPRRLGPKRASKIRKLFNLTKDDDVRKYVIRRELPKKEGKKARTKAPKIQRLVTPVTLQRKRRRISLRKKTIERHKQEAADYAKLLAQRNKEKRQALVSKKRTTSKKSVSVKDAEKKVEKDTKEVKKEAGKGKKEAAVKTAGKGKKEAAVKTAGKGKKEAAVKTAGKGKKEAAPKKEAGKKDAAPKKEAGKKDAAPKKDAPKKEAAGKKEAPKKDAGKKAAAKPAGKSATKK